MLCSSEKWVVEVGHYTLACGTYWASSPLCSGTWQRGWAGRRNIAIPTLNPLSCLSWGLKTCWVTFLHIPCNTAAWCRQGKILEKLPVCLTAQLWTVCQPWKSEHSWRRCRPALQFCLVTSYKTLWNQRQRNQAAPALDKPQWLDKKEQSPISRRCRAICAYT